MTSYTPGAGKIKMKDKDKKVSAFTIWIILTAFNVLLLIATIISLNEREVARTETHCLEEY
jgi:hypothetical protein